LVASIAGLGGKIRKLAVSFIPGTPYLLFKISSWLFNYLYFSSMKKYLILCVLIFPLLLLSFVLPKSTGQSPDLKTPADNSFNLLATYGEYVFGREGCLNCHTLVENTSPGKVSLDGLTNKFTIEWHYMHLVDPQMMIPNSRMPSFKRLTKRDINFTKVVELFQLNNKYTSQPDSTVILSQIQHPIDSIQKIFDSFGLAHDNLKYKEIVPLIFWLQRIKPSASKKVSDSIRVETANREYANKLYLWKKWINDHKSAFYQTANSRDKKVLGKGAHLFQRSCTACHNRQAQGSVGPNLTDAYWLNGNRIEDLANTIRFGHNAMPAWETVLSPEDISHLIAYIRSLKGSNPPNPKVPQGEKRSD
jgi:cytochrome c oxidase cbb3-type subunit III